MGCNLYGGSVTAGILGGIIGGAIHNSINAKDLTSSSVSKYEKIVADSQYYADLNGQRVYYTAEGKELGSIPHTEFSDLDLSVDDVVLVSL